MCFHVPQETIRLRGIFLGRRTVSSFRVRLSASVARVPWAALLAVVVLIAQGTVPAQAKEKIRLGAVENVALLPWGVLMPARIDTGAATSSLDARNLVVKGKTVEFNLPPQE